MERRARGQSKGLSRLSGSLKTIDGIQKKAGRTDPRAQDPGEGKCDPEREREPAANPGTLTAGVGFEEHYHRSRLAITKCFLPDSIRFGKFGLQSQNLPDVFGKFTYPRQASGILHNSYGLFETTWEN